jgi:hypothetical protein
MFIPYAELSDGAFYFAPNDTTMSLRQKGGDFSDCALTSAKPGKAPASRFRLKPDARNRFPSDPSLLVFQVRL